MADKFVAHLSRFRMSARKARLVADLVRGKKVSDALDILSLTKKKAAPVLKKQIQSAIANAQQRATVDVDRLIVSEIYVNEGPTMRRFIPRAQGRAAPIRKRSSHITVMLKEL